MAKVTEIDCTAARLQQKQLIEMLKQDRARLMNGTKDSLTSVSKLAKEADNVESGPRVETRCGLVKEHEELRLAGKLNANCKPLSLLLIQPRAGCTDCGACNVSHFQ